MRLSLLACLALFATLLGCEAPDRVLHPHHRFELAGAEAERASKAPVATIGFERRGVVYQHPVTWIDTSNKSFDTNVLERELSDAFASSSHAVAVSHYLGTSLPPRGFPIRRNADRAPSVRLNVIPRLDNGDVLQTVELTALPNGNTVEHLTSPTTIPKDARLEFGFGVLDAARRHGVVVFALEVCEEGRCELRFQGALDPDRDAGWQDRAVDLTRDAGRALSLRLRATFEKDGPRRFLLPVWSTPILYASEERPREQRSVILISLDTLGADRMSIYGSSRSTTPYLAEKFGREGVVFENLVAAATTTGPAHMTMFTSLQPAVHGVGSNRGKTRLPAAATTLAEQLTRNGFKCAAITENAAISARRGFARGFDEFVADKGEAYIGADGLIEVTFDRGLQWWRRNRDKPFFLFLHTYQPHAPYEPPAGFREELGEDPNPPSAVEPALADQSDRYDAEIRYSDDAVERFLETLHREGMKDTVVMVTSDHGEEFGEHGFSGHGLTLHSEVLHVPLMIHGEGVPGGLRLDEPVAHVDLMPTILELAGVPRSDGLMGRSLVGAWEGDTAPTEAVPVYSETWLTKGTRATGEKASVDAPALAVRSGDRKLIRYRGADFPPYQYFDLANDPQEQRNLYDPTLPRVKELKVLLDAYLPAMEQMQSDLKQRSSADTESETLGIDPMQEQKLRALGYVE